MIKTCRILLPLVFLFCISADTFNEKWKLLSSTINARFITFDWQGNLYAIDTNDEGYMQGKRNSWIPLMPNTKLKFITIFPDGTIFALDKTTSLGYRRRNGEWKTENGNVKALVSSKDGTSYLLYNDGTVSQSDGTKLTGNYTFISASSNDIGIYLIGVDGKIYVYSKGRSNTPAEILSDGKQKGKCAAGSGYGVEGGHYILGDGYDSNVYYYDIAIPKNKWTKLESNLFMKYIAMKPSGNLYGIGADDKIYYLSEPY